MGDSLKRIGSHVASGVHKSYMGAAKLWRFIGPRRPRRCLPSWLSKCGSDQPSRSAAKVQYGPWYGTGSSDWMQMDLGQGVNVRGIVVEAAGIHSLRVQYALYDSDAAFNEINEDLVVGDVINTAGNNVEQLPVEVLFPAVVHARYLRLVVGTSVGWSLWSNTAGIRAAAMVCLPTCPDGIIVNPD
eukprot:5920490-Amphidinium_carterae.1